MKNFLYSGVQQRNFLCLIIATNKTLLFKLLRLSRFKIDYNNIENVTQIMLHLKIFDWITRYVMCDWLLDMLIGFYMLCVKTKFGKIVF